MKEVSVLLATADAREDMIPIAVMDIADMKTLRDVIGRFVSVSYNWDECDKDLFVKWVDEIADAIHHDCEYSDSKDTTLKMSLYTAPLVWSC